MKLLRYGPKGQEKPGIVDSQGRIRDLSKVVPDIAGDTLSPKGLAKIAEVAGKVSVEETDKAVKLTITDDKGEYVLRLLPPGTYNVTVRRIGYAPGELTGQRSDVGADPGQRLPARRGDGEGRSHQLAHRFERDRREMQTR